MLWEKRVYEGYVEAYSTTGEAAIRVRELRDSGIHANRISNGTPHNCMEQFTASLTMVFWHCGESI